MKYRRADSDIRRAGVIQDVIAGVIQDVIACVIQDVIASVILSVAWSLPFEYTV